jgi:anti-sigma28 factor (negative regulator of flagellin synthesis)
MKVVKKTTGAVTDGTQLSKLSSVLSGLEQGAYAMRRRAQQLMRAVRSGTYEVDPLKLSRRIIGDTLASA